MDNNETKVLIETFRSYRDLLSPIQTNLNDFIETYDSMKNDIEKLNGAFGGDIKGKLEDIYKNLSAQAGKASDLASRIDHFAAVTNKYTSEVSQLLAAFKKLEDRIQAVNDLENRAEEQIGRLDSLLEEKNKNYNIKDLQKTLDSYNSNVQKVAEFINQDVADTLIESQKKLESIKGGIEDVVKKQRDGNTNVERLLQNYTASGEMLKRIAEKQDVNEIYIFELLDKWAESRKVKTRK